jgi:hypothetical protein
MIEITKYLKQNGIFEIMKPYVYGCFSFLGTPMILGNKDPNMMRNVLNNIVDEFVDEKDIFDIKQFINNIITYNKLQNKTRLAICEVLYGIKGNCESDGFK